MVEPIEDFEQQNEDEDDDDAGWDDYGDEEEDSPRTKALKFMDEVEMDRKIDENRALIEQMQKT